MPWSVVEGRALRNPVRNCGHAPVVDPPAAELDELAGRDHRRVPDPGDQGPLPPSLHPQHAEPLSALWNVTRSTSPSVVALCAAEKVKPPPLPRSASIRPWRDPETGRSPAAVTDAACHDRRRNGAGAAEFPDLASKRSIGSLVSGCLEQLPEYGYQSFLDLPVLIIKSFEFLLRSGLGAPNTAQQHHAVDLPRNLRVWR